MSTNEHVHPNPIPTSNNHETLIHTSQPATIEAPIGSSPLPTSTTNEIHSLNIEQQKTIESKQQEIKQKEQILAIKREEEITEQQQQQPNQQSSHTTTITNTNEQTKTENMSESSSQQPKQIKQENQTTNNGSLTNKNDENNNNNTATVRKILAPANPQVANGVSGSSGSVASKSVTPPRNPIVLNSGTPQSSSSSSSSKPKIMSPLDIKMQNYKNRQLMMGGGGGGNGVVLPTTMTTIVTNNNANNSSNTGSSHPLEPVESHSHNKQSSSSSSSASLLPRPRSDSHNRSSPNRHHSHHSSRSSSGRNDFSHNSGNFNQRKPDPRDHFGHFTRSAQDYYFYEKLGEGTYGEVFKARCKRTNEIVALKKIRMDREEQGFPITAIREIIILKSLDHENIVRLREVIAAIDQPIFYMVFDYVEHDLAGLLDARVPFTEGQVKSLVKQLLSALRECHRRKILHRDLKASNLLITQQGVLKLADFGLSRFMQQGKNRYTNRVITRWYRPPELLLGSTEYTSKIDMWSVGCILGEMILGSKTMFPGRTELEQLELIWKICGTPTMESWAAVSNQPLWKECKPKRECKRVLKEKFSQTLFSKEAIDLLDKLLVLDPEKRLSAEECLQHDWFKKGPEPERPFNLPSRTCNEYGARKRKERGGVGPDMPPPLSHNPNIGHHGIPSEPYYSDIHPSKKMRYTNAHGTNFRHPPRSGHMDGGGRPQIGGPPGASGSFIPPSGTSGDHHGHHPQQQHGSRFHHGSGPHGSSGGGHGNFYNGPRGSSRQPYHTRDGYPPSFKGGNPKHGPATNGPDNNSGNTGSTEPQQHHHSQQHHSSRDGGDGNRPSYSHNKGDRQSYHHHNRSNYSGGPRRYQGGGGGGEYHHRGSGGSNRDNYSSSRSGGGDYHHHHGNRSFDPSTHHRDHPPQHGSSAHHHHGSSANGSGGGSSDGGANGHSHHPSRHSSAQDSSGRPPSSSSKRRDEHHSSHHGSSGGSKEGHQPPQSSTN